MVDIGYDSMVSRLRMMNNAMIISPTQNVPQLTPLPSSSATAPITSEPIEVPQHSQFLQKRVRNEGADEGVIKKGGYIFHGRCPSTRYWGERLR